MCFTTALFSTIAGAGATAQRQGQGQPRLDPKSGESIMIFIPYYSLAMVGVGEQPQH